MSPKRLDFVQVKTSRRTVVLPWVSRDALLEEIRHLDSMKPVAEAFAGVGASRPVTLTFEEEVVLLRVVDFWMQRVGASALPDGVVELRNALYDDLHDTAQSAGGG